MELEQPDSDQQHGTGKGILLDVHPSNNTHFHSSGVSQLEDASNRPAEVPPVTRAEKSNSSHAHMETRPFAAEGEASSEPRIPIYNDDVFWCINLHKTYPEL